MKARTLQPGYCFCQNMGQNTGRVSTECDSTFVSNFLDTCYNKLCAFFPADDKVHQYKLRHDYCDTDASCWKKLEN